MGHFSLRANNPLRNIRNENLPLPIELNKTVRYIYIKVELGRHLKQNGKCTYGDIIIHTLIYIKDYLFIFYFTRF